MAKNSKTTKKGQTTSVVTAPAKKTKEKAESPVGLPETQDEISAPVAQAICPIIGMGASAGGLEAFEQFFRNMPPDSGMAFVLISHLDPGHASMLTEIMQRATVMSVVEVRDQMAVEPDHVYVIPPNRALSIFHGVLQITAPEEPRGQRMPIDAFLHSLADDQGEKAIGIILSGTGADGTLGLRAIQEAGGVSFVQEPSTAKYDGMPSSAIQRGFATYILPVEQMPKQLIAACVKKRSTETRKPVSAVPAKAGSLNKIMLSLRSKTGHDFSLYKQSTTRRRIERRMTDHNIENIDVYARYLNEHPDEVKALFKELLINVTGFFRDVEAFEALKKDIMPQMFEQKQERYIFRVWVPGCATGEEAYSIAMVFREYMDDIGKEFRVQIYATDLDEDAIAAARSGSYPLNIVTDVSQERLRRFFIRDETRYRVKKEIREMIVFATQNVIKDPPFTKLDMLSCRNLLIYLDPELQNRIIPRFHYALKPGGVLFLSPSESVGSFHDLFMPVSKKWKFYRSKASSLPSARTAMASGIFWSGDQTEKRPGETVIKAKETNFAELAKRVLLQSYAPSSVVTDEDGNILYVHGETGKYLRPAPGQASLNVVEMAREGLKLELKAAIRSAVSRKKQADCKDLRVKANGGSIEANLAVRPLVEPDTAQILLIISFQETEPDARGKSAKPRQTAAGHRHSKRLDELERELLYTKENLQATMEEMQASNEELKSANEELQSTNEELQSTNEELETSKEEIQSVNEELMTVNAELQAKIEQLTRMQNDMKNLLEGTNIGTIFLDGNLAIKRFTREAAAVFRMVATDTGRPLSDIKSNISVELSDDARAVLDSLVPRERQVQTTGNAWYLIRIMPYRTLENMIDGVVLTFTDITALKKAEDEIQKAREYAENIVNTVREPLLVLDGYLKVVSASRSFYKTFGVSHQETDGRLIYELGNRQWDILRLRELLETILPQNSVIEDMEVAHDFPGLGPRKMLLNARRIEGQAGEPELILLAMEDVTKRQ